VEMGVASLEARDVAAVGEDTAMMVEECDASVGGEGDTARMCGDAQH
jgi:hypothetical protein